jgi:hypothetical protein
MPATSVAGILCRGTKRGGVLPIISFTAVGDIWATVLATKQPSADFPTKPADEDELAVTAQAAIWQCTIANQERRDVAEIERQLATVLFGKLNKQITALFGTVERNIQVHRAGIMRKTGASTLVALLWLAERVDFATKPTVAIQYTDAATLDLIEAAGAGFRYLHMSRLSAVLTKALLPVLAACAVCFAQQPFDYTKPLSTEKASAELDGIKYKSLTEFLSPDPKSRIYQDHELDVYFTAYKAIGDVGESSCRQRDLPNHHERCFILLSIYRHPPAHSHGVAGVSDGDGGSSLASYWAISEAFQLMCEENTMRDLGSVVYREGRDNDVVDLWDGSWEDWGYGRPAEHMRAIDETDRLAVLARDKLCKG